MKSLMEYGQVKLEKKYYIDLENYYKTIGKLTSFYNYIAQLAKDDDKEGRHINMDNLMCELLRHLGYDAGVKIFDDTDMWYA